MNSAENGRLTLKTVPGGKDREAVIAYLAKLFKNVSRDNLAAFIKKTPAVLSRNVPDKAAQKIIAQLQKLGATAVYLPNGSPDLETIQGKISPESRVADLKGPILGAFQVKLPRVPVSGLYRLGLSLVAFAMLLLPLVYLGLIGVACYLLYWHATESVNLFNSVRDGRLALFGYGAPMLVGILLVLFMIKPLFVRRAWYFKPSKIERRDEPLLYSFVERLCKRVGAPMPDEIHLDINVNASASFRRGLLSLFSNDLVLTIGLPLAGGLNLHQFAGVLAHEFGHFAQATGMRITYIIRSVNFWFERVVYEEDEWDERIRRWSRQWDFRIAIILLIARLFIWLTRRILWVLMVFGHAISSFMLRQMEYDADRYETHLVGAEVFESTARRLVELTMAYQGAFQDLENSWEEGRLVDNLPALILANEGQIPEDTRQKILTVHFTEAQTGLFDTHPCDRDRIASARELKAKPLFKLDISHPTIRETIAQVQETDAAGLFSSSPPASILFKDFDGRSLRTSLDYYRGVFGKEVMPKNLVSASAMVQSQDEEWEYSRSLNRFSQGLFNVLRPLGLPDGPIKPPSNPKEILQTIRSTREMIRASGAKYTPALESFNDLEGQIVEAFQIRALLDAGFHLSEADVDAMNATFQEVEEGKRLAVLDKLNPFEKLLHDRMIGALQLLSVQAVAARIENGEELKQVTERFMKTANLLETQMPAVRDFNIAYQQLGALVNQLESNQENEQLVRQIRSKMREVRKSLAALKNRLDGMDYPFEHTKDRMTLGDFALGYIPEDDDLGPLLDAAYQAIDKILRVYARLAGRLTNTAELVEKALGLEPLPEPQQSQTQPGQIAVQPTA
jgi:Zn-dependent protease with chaperone function